MKLQEISLEEQLIENGTHPDYIDSLKDLEVSKDARLKLAKDYHARLIDACHDVFYAQIQSAQDSFTVSPFPFMVSINEKI